MSIYLPEYAFFTQTFLAEKFVQALLVGSFHARNPAPEPKMKELNQLAEKFRRLSSSSFRIDDLRRFTKYSYFRSLQQLWIVLQACPDDEQVNRAYIGEYRYGDIVTPDGMPAIVSKEVFEAAQKRLVQNKRQGGQRANGLTPDEVPHFWLTGKLYCGKCGTPMRGCSGTSGHRGTKHYYYACGAARKRKCSLKYVKNGKIETIACFMLSQCLKD